MGSTMEALMQKRLKEKQDAYDAQWADGSGSHHPDYDPTVTGPKVHKASGWAVHALAVATWSLSG